MMNQRIATDMILMGIEITADESRALTAREYCGAHDDAARIRADHTARLVAALADAPAAGDDLSALLSEILMDPDDVEPIR